MKVRIFLISDDRFPENGKDVEEGLVQFSASPQPAIVPAFSANDIGFGQRGLFDPSRDSSGYPYTDGLGGWVSAEAIELLPDSSPESQGKWNDAQKWAEFWRELTEEQ